MATELENQLAQLKQGDHICLIYENAAEQLAVAAPFIKDGLFRGERCIYVADDRTVEEVVAAMTAAGVDVVRERQRDALRLLTKGDSYLAAGEFAPRAMLEFVQRAEAEALADGCSGLRFTGEMTWALGTEPGCDRLMEYEALLGEMEKNSRSVILCQYNRARFDAPSIYDVLRTHRLAILGDQLCDNPYFENSAMVLSQNQMQGSAALKRQRVDWWIAQLRRAKAAEVEREERENSHRAAVLWERERKLAQAQRAAHLGYWEYDFDADRVTGSDECCWILGIPPQSVATEAEFRQWIHPDDRPIQAEAWAKATRGRGTYEVEYRVLRRDGEVRFVHSIDEVIRDESGRPIRAFGVWQDITERKIAQDELKRQKEQIALQLAELENIYASAPVGLGSVDRHFRFVRINEQLAAMNGVSVAEHIGRTVREVIPQIADEVEGLWKRVFTSGQPVLNVEIHGETAAEPGVDRYWLVNYVPLRSAAGTVVGGTGAVVEITEQKRALAKLKKSERRLAEAQQVAHIGSWERDLRTDEIAWSAETFRLFGEQQSPQTITFASFLARVCPDDVKRLQHCLDCAIRGRQPFRCEYRLATSDGTLRWLHDRGAVVVDEAGAPIRLVGTVQDITERKRIDAERESLYQQVLASREELRVLSRRLIQTQEEERRRLARELHDEIGQVLTAVSLSLELALGTADLATKERLQESVAVVDRAIDQVRGMSLNLRPAMLDVMGLESALRWFVDRQMKTTGVKIDLVGSLGGERLPPELETACFRIIQESLTNVARHAGARNVLVELTRRGGEMFLSIQDDGTGFDVAAARQHATTGGSFGLLGMEERTRLLGGTFQIDSAIGSGTTVRVRLPLA